LFLDTISYPKTNSLDFNQLYLVAVVAVGTVLAVGAVLAALATLQGVLAVAAALASLQVVLAVAAVLESAILHSILRGNIFIPKQMSLE
jgi:hypothetical protein